MEMVKAQWCFLKDDTFTPAEIESEWKKIAARNGFDSSHVEGKAENLVYRVYISKELESAIEAG